MRKFTLALLIILVWTGCKKETDDNPPTVRILAPPSGANIVMPMTLDVEAEYEDDVRIESVSFGLVDDNYNRVGERVYAHEPTNPGSFAQTLEVYDLDIENGQHYVEVIASDGVNDEREYREVQVTAIPRSMLGIAYISEFGGGYELSFLNEEGETSLIEAGNDAAQFAISGRYLESYVFADNILNQYRLEDNELEWSVSDVFPASQALVSMLYSQTQRRLVLMSDGPEIKAYNFGGGLVSQLDLASDLDVIELLQDEDDYWLLTNSLNGYRLLQLYKSTGFVKATYPLSFTPTHMTAVSDEEFVIVDDEGDLHVIDTYNDDQYTISVQSIGLIVDVVSYAGRVYFASSSDLFRYDIGDSQALPLQSGTDISALVIDNLNQRLIISQSGGLEFRALSTWQYQGSVSLPYMASSIQAVFNK